MIVLVGFLAVGVDLLRSGRACSQVSGASNEKQSIKAVGRVCCQIRQGQGLYILQIVRLGLYRGPEIQLGVLIVLVLERGKTASAVENNCHLLCQLLKISVGHSSRFLVRFGRGPPFGAVGW